LQIISLVIAMQLTPNFYTCGFALSSVKFYHACDPFDSICGRGEKHARSGGAAKTEIKDGTGVGVQWLALAGS